MPYSILKYGSLMLLGIENLEHAKEEAIQFVMPTGYEYTEIWDSKGETVAFGHLDGKRFH